MKVMLVTKNDVVLGNTYRCPAVAAGERVMVGATRIQGQTPTSVGLKVYMSMMAAATKGQMIVNRPPALLRAQKWISSLGARLHHKMARVLLQYHLYPPYQNHCHLRIRQNPCLPDNQDTHGQRERSGSVLTV